MKALPIIALPYSNITALLHSSITAFLPKLLYAFFTSGILHSSSGLLPHTLHSPTLFLSIGLLVAQVPRNSLPVTIWRILMRMNEIPKKPKIMARIYKNSIVFISNFQAYHLSNKHLIQKQVYQFSSFSCTPYTAPSLLPAYTVQSQAYSTSRTQYLLTVPPSSIKTYLCFSTANIRPCNIN